MDPITQKKPLTSLITVLIFLFIAYVAWTEYRAYTLEKTIATLEAEHQNTAHSLDTLYASSSESSTAVTNLYTTLSRVISEEGAKNTALEEKLGMVSNTVGSLDKLSKSDPQLLKKYSKVYFLNENYLPISLSNIPAEYGWSKNFAYQVHSEVFPFLTSLIEQATQDGMDLKIISAFRSFATQATVKSSNKVLYGAGTANQFSAEQGFSEHQLGTTVDFTTTKTGDSFVKFDGTAEYQWLKVNAHKFGFVISYPKGNTFYAYEPWHWRFVGVDLASQLHADEKYFYDLDQRVIDGYLIKMFDK